MDAPSLMSSCLLTHAINFGCDLIMIHKNPRSVYTLWVLLLSTIYKFIIVVNQFVWKVAMTNFIAFIWI